MRWKKQTYLSFVRAIITEFRGMNYRFLWARLTGPNFTKHAASIIIIMITTIRRQREAVPALILDRLVWYVWHEDAIKTELTLDWKKVSHPNL